jgi:hypothetical protein
MPQAVSQTVEAETIERLAKEVVRIPLSPAETTGLVALINALNSEIDKVTLEDRAGAEPDLLFSVEGWS